MAEGFMGGLVEGFLSQVAPTYFNAMKQQEQDSAKTAKNKATAKLYADHIKNINAPLRAATNDPRRISIYDSMENMAAMQGEDIAKMFPEYFGDVIKHNLEDSNRSVVQKNADYVYNEAIPEQNREMVRQIEMHDRPSDVQERAIKQQNADTLSSYRKAQTSGAVPGISGRGKLMSNGMPLPRLKPDEMLNPDGSVSAMHGSDLEKNQSAKHADAAKETSSIVSLYDNVSQTGTELLNSKNFDALFGKGDIATGAMAHITKYIAPNELAQLNQLKEQLKTLGGMTYKRVAGSPGSMQYKEWEIFEKQLASLETNIGADQAKKIISGLIKSIDKMKLFEQESYINEFGDDKKRFNPSAAGLPENNIPNELSSVFTRREGHFKFDEGRNLKQDMLDGSIYANENGKWVKQKLNYLEDGFELVPAEGVIAPTEDKELEAARKRHGL